MELCAQPWADCVGTRPAMQGGGETLRKGGGGLWERGEREEGSTLGWGQRAQEMKEIMEEEGNC